MRLPGTIGRPLFDLLYRQTRGSLAISPLRRTVRQVSAENQQAFDDLVKAALINGGRGQIDYQLPYPKSDFLNYLCDWKGYVAHGSPLMNLERLEPVRLGTDTNEFGNRRQVFGSPDAMWAMWFAILDKSKVNKTDNGCVRVGQGARRVKYYHFELPRESRSAQPFVEGMIYLARSEDFPDHRSHGHLRWFDAEVEEWGSVEPVTSVLRIVVKPQEFPYLHLVEYRL
jgi:hypothetical protein